MPIYIVNNGNLFTYRIFVGQIVPLNQSPAGGLLLDQVTAVSAAVVLIACVVADNGKAYSCMR